MHTIIWAFNSIFFGKVTTGMPVNDILDPYFKEPELLVGTTFVQSFIVSRNWLLLFIAST